MREQKTKLPKLPHDHDTDHLLAALAVIPKSRRRLAVDGGAHTGAWTRILADRFEQVIAFEPHRGHASEIEETETVTVHTLALGQNIEKAGLAPGPDNEGQWHLRPGGDDVWIVPLDAYRLEGLDLLKLDVEGFEYPALKGAKDTVERWKPWVLVEQNELPKTLYGQDARAAHKLLRQWGYRRVGAWNKDHLYAP